MPRSDRPKVVVTGIGVVSPNGIGRDAFLRGCSMGRSGVSPLNLPDAPALKSTVAAQVKGFEPESVMEPA